MADETVTKSINDSIDEFDLQQMSASSLTCILSDLICETQFKSDFGVNEPDHPEQRMHACLTAIQHQLMAIKKTVHSMPALAAN